MPIHEALMAKLQAKYGRDEGERVYFALEAQGRGPFAPGASHRQDHLDFADRHGLTPQGTRKPRPPKKAGRRRRR